MTSTLVALLLAHLGMAKGHSRAHISNDNPHFRRVSQFGAPSARVRRVGRSGDDHTTCHAHVRWRWGS